MSGALALLHELAGVVHGGGLVVFAVLVLLRRRLSPLTEPDVVRVYRAWGAGAGVSLGLFLYTEAALWPGRVNPGVGGMHAFDLAGGLEGLRLGLLFAYWVSYVWLEIWTLEPCRLLDKGGVVTDGPAYAATAARVSLQLALNAALFVAVLGLGQVLGVNHPG